MKILFMGTPDFALSSLKALAKSGENIVGVVTQPDRPRGRGYALMPPPVKVYAEEQGIPVYQPSTLKGEEFAALLDSVAPDMIVVAAYGKILPENVIDYPRYGCINVHGSLLPEYRGAAPIQRAIIDGKDVTGITIMYMDKGLDTGDMILSARTDIGESDNFETLHDRLAQLGAQTLISAIELIKSGKAKRTPQDGAAATYASKIEKSDSLIDFGLPAHRVHDLIRGLSPIPLAFTHTPDTKVLKIVSARVSDRATDAPAGTVISVDGGITVACGEGAVTLLTVVPEGKSKMSAEDFVRGRKISVGDVLS